LSRATVSQRLVEFARFPVATYFCDGKYSDKQNPRYIFGSLLKQLLLSKPSFKDGMKKLGDLYESHKFDENRRALTSTDRGKEVIEKIVTLLQDELMAFKKAYFIIDGIDECEEREDLLAGLMALEDSKKGNIFVTCRSSAAVDVERAFADKPVIAIDNHVKGDIEQYIEWVLGNDKDFKTLGPSLKERIRRTLVEKSESM
jgi:hypothetical protein